MNPISTAKNAVESLMNTEDDKVHTPHGNIAQLKWKHLMALWDQLGSRSVSRIETAVDNDREVILDGCIDGSRIATEYDPEENRWYTTFERDACDDPSGSYTLTIRV